VTVHPAAILRAPVESQDAEYARFAADIALAAESVVDRRSEMRTDVPAPN
jgi:hypothetical protein